MLVSVIIILPSLMALCCHDKSLFHIHIKKVVTNIVMKVTCYLHISFIYYDIHGFIKFTILCYSSLPVLCICIFFLVIVPHTQILPFHILWFLSPSNCSFYFSQHNLYLCIYRNLKNFQCIFFHSILSLHFSQHC